MILNPESSVHIHPIIDGIRKRSQCSASVFRTLHFLQRKRYHDRYAGNMVGIDLALLNAYRQLWNIKPESH